MDMLDKTAVFVFSPINLFSAVLIEILLDIYAGYYMKMVLLFQGNRFRGTMCLFKRGHVVVMLISCLFIVCANPVLQVEEGNI